jgi:hypothetical protein
MAPAGMQNMHSSAHAHRGRKRTSTARLNSITHSAIQPAAANEASTKTRSASIRRPLPVQQAGAGVDMHFYSDGTLIAGTLAEVSHPVAAAVLITGSGKLNRDSDARLGRRGPVVLRTGITRQIAEALTAANVATLRYDSPARRPGSHRRAGHHVADRRDRPGASRAGQADHPPHRPGLR